MHLSRPLAILATGLLIAQGALAQGDGPRTYMLVPSGTDLLSGFYIHLDGNQTADPALLIPDSEIDIDLAVAMYTKTFGLGGKQGAVFAILPYGEVEGSLGAFGQTLSGSADGLGDLTLGGIMGLINSPDLPALEYGQHAAMPNLAVLAKLTLPTGTYDPDKTLNMGANRWALQFGFPMAAYIGDSMVDPRLTSFELFPSATFFSENEDSGSGNSSATQDVLYKIEGHITHNLNKSLWVSLDAERIFGGETNTNGNGNDNAQNSFALGGTVSYAFTPATFVKASYGQTVWQNSNGLDGDMLRIQFGYAF